jgi:UDP-2-acetamido-3-amino-2,3-dideoxy-glucuronate N-acetyltransferase
MAAESEYRAHPAALVETDQIGAGTRIWAFVHVMAGAVIGRNCNIGDHCYIESGVRIGDEVVVKNGVLVWDGVTLEDRVFVGPGVVFTNDRMPRVKAIMERWECLSTLVHEGASLGANATILPGITIGRYALIGAGAVVTRDVPDFALMTGNPARRLGYVCRCAKALSFTDGEAACSCGLPYRMIDDTVVEGIPDPGSSVTPPEGSP